MSTVLRPLDFTAAHLDSDLVIRLSFGARLRSWAAVHARSLAVLTVLLPLVGVLHAWNMYRSPAINITDDEGTYVNEAWAVVTWHQLSHYTYWYDHPPLGWIQIGLYSWLTDAWARAPYSIAVGREFMLVVDLTACALLYLLARRLQLPRWAAAAAVILFAASPLSLQYHRMVWLDNIGALWLIAALALAAAPRKSLGSAAGSAACLAVSVLSKETFLILAPVVGYLLWQHSDRRTRRYRMAIFTLVASTLALFYPLYAVVKNELIPGPNHVSLLWAIRWQLTLRSTNGSIFNPSTEAAGYFHSWLHLDPWLLAAGLALAVPALLCRRLRPLAVAMLLEAVLVLRPGYLPEAYIVAVLPFAALIIAGMAHQLNSLRTPRLPTLLTHGLLALPLITGVAVLAPLWVRGDTAQLTGGTTVKDAQMVSWVAAHVGARQHMVVDDNVWLDLVRAGYDPKPPVFAVTWVYKVGTDPSIRLPPGLRAVDYFVYALNPSYAAKDAPQIVAPFQHSVLVATFGTGDNTIYVRKVIRPGATAATPLLTGERTVATSAVTETAPLPAATPRLPHSSSARRASPPPPGRRTPVAAGGRLLSREPVQALLAADR